MASANLELVRSICTTWERGDFSRAAEWAHPEIEFVIADGPAPGNWTGLAGLADGWRDFLGAWQDVRQETDEYRELDNARILVLTHFIGRGRTSGMEVGQIRSKGEAGLFHISGGRVTRLVYYLDRERALADVGLPSEASTSS